MQRASTSRPSTPTDVPRAGRSEAPVCRDPIQAAIKAVIVDVDGVVSPVLPDPSTLPWSDECVAGNVFGPVLVSPRLAERLDALDRVAGVQCWWLTSWTPEMRARMIGFPGGHWPVVAEADTAAANDRRWWKRTAVETWLDNHPEITAVAWCDDHLRGGAPAAVRRGVHNRGLPAPLLIAPKTAVGLTPVHLDKLEKWAAEPAAPAAPAATASPAKPA